MKLEKVDNLGTINFGTFKGKAWNDLPRHYLEYLMSDECLTTQLNKDMAKKALQNKGKNENQILMF